MNRGLIRLKVENEFKCHHFIEAHSMKNQDIQNIVQAADIESNLLKAEVHIQLVR